jgi:hypothetical protein
MLPTAAAAALHQMIAIVRDPKYAMKPQGLKGLLSRLLPPTPDWVNHMLLHDVVDADITMQHGLDVNRCAHCTGEGVGPAYARARKRRGVEVHGP